MFIKSVNLYVSNLFLTSDKVIMLTDVVSPVNMVSAKNITGPVLRDSIGLTRPQLPDLSDVQLATFKGETGNLSANIIPTPHDLEKLTTDNDSYMRAGAGKSVMVYLMCGDLYKRENITVTILHIIRYIKIV